jgi:hypothetical protein
MTGGSQFRPPAPPVLASAEWAANYNEIKALGGRNSAKRSAQQSENAHFWLATDGRVYYPILHQVAEAKKLGVLDRARMFALAAVARNDAFTAVFDAKYHYDRSPQFAMATSTATMRPSATQPGNRSARRQCIPSIRAPTASRAPPWRAC